jgi:tetraacyldisaccharide 4'-kinase
MRAPEFWSGRTPAQRAVSALLSPLGALYDVGGRIAQRRAPPFRPRAKVFCVGNLTAGGTGKTPLAIALARMLAARGRRIVFLTRGYGGRHAGPVRVEPRSHSAADVGDEALLLAAAQPTIVARDRAAGAAAADSIGADIILMDDGYQNPSLHKDAAIVVIDAETGFGNGAIIPAGPLREPVARGMARASAAVLVGQGDVDLGGFKGPVFRACILPDVPEALRGADVFAFAGIGRPEKFFATLRACGARLVATQAFADHHAYSTWELSALKASAARAGARLVTTEKDYVRIPPVERQGIGMLPVHAAITPDPRLDALLDNLAHGSRNATG